MLNFIASSSLLHLRQPFHHYSSAFCRVNIGGKCSQAGIERDQSGPWAWYRPGGKYRSIRHRKVSVIQTGFFGRLERAPEYWNSIFFFMKRTKQADGQADRQTDRQTDRHSFSRVSFLIEKTSM